MISWRKPGTFTPEHPAYSLLVVGNILLPTFLAYFSAIATIVADNVSGATASGSDLPSALASLADGMEARYRELEAASPLRWPHDRRTLARLRGYFGSAR